MALLELAVIRKLVARKLLVRSLVGQELVRIYGARRADWRAWLLCGCLLSLGASGCSLLDRVAGGCSTWPLLGGVEEVVSQHESVVRDIEAINPGHTGIIVNTWTCPGKARLTFTYATLDDKRRIQDIIGADTFFGVSFTLRNI